MSGTPETLEGPISWPRLSGDSDDLPERIEADVQHILTHSAKAELDREILLLLALKEPAYIRFFDEALRLAEWEVTHLCLGLLQWQQCRQSTTTEKELYLQCLLSLANLAAAHNRDQHKWDHTCVHTAEQLLGIGRWAA